VPVPGRRGTSFCGRATAGHDVGWLQHDAYFDPKGQPVPEVNRRDGSYEGRAALTARVVAASREGVLDEESERIASFGAFASLRVAFAQPIHR